MSYKLKKIIYIYFIFKRMTNCKTVRIIKMEKNIKK